MNAYLIPGMMGLLTGLLLRWGLLHQPEGLRTALGLRRSLTLRTGLSALGWGTLLTALLMWLAVIDVDHVEVLPLSPGALLGGAIFGVCTGICGFTPTTAFAGLCSHCPPEALCVIAGCFAGTALSPALSGLLTPLHTPWADASLFQVTLDEPWLLGGGHLALGCLGLLLTVWGACIPSPKAAVVPDGVIAERAAEAAEPLPAEDSPDPADAPEETVVAVLEGEEPLIVDTALDEAIPQPEAVEASQEPLPADEEVPSDEASDKADAHPDDPEEDTEDPRED